MCKLDMMEEVVWVAQAVQEVALVEAAPAGTIPHQQCNNKSLGTRRRKRRRNQMQAKVEETRKCKLDMRLQMVRSSVQQPLLETRPLGTSEENSDNNSACNNLCQGT